MQTEFETCPAGMPDVGARLEQALAHAAHFLPAQGPINVFVHHNTLHAFEEQGFHEAVASAAATFGCHPYLPEADYRLELVAGRISEAQIEAALTESTGVGEQFLADGLTTRLKLRRSMLLSTLHIAPAAELKWLMAETDALERFPKEIQRSLVAEMIEATKRWVIRDYSNREGLIGESKKFGSRLVGLMPPGQRTDPVAWTEADWEEATLKLLWGLCSRGVADVPARTRQSEGLRHRDFLFRGEGVDSDRPVNELLIRFCAAYLDQGFSQWELPGRQAGFYRSFLELYSRPGMSPGSAYDGLSRELQRHLVEGISATDSTLDSLQQLGVCESEWDEFLSQTLLALRGWAGMLHQLEQRGDRVPLGVPRRSLAEYLAVRLIVERVVLQNLLNRLGLVAVMIGGGLYPQPFLASRFRAAEHLLGERSGGQPQPIHPGESGSEPRESEQTGREAVGESHSVGVPAMIKSRQVLAAEGFAMKWRPAGRHPIGEGGPRERDALDDH